jgi:uncharacterized protein
VSNTGSEATQLLSGSARLKLFVMLRRTLEPALLREHLAEHLRWMIAAEKRGAIFLSGPIAKREGASHLDGLTIIRAASLADAEALAADDPLVRIGAVAFEMREWTANEGAINVTVTLSDSAASFH